jgi:hypothetical protein
MRQIGIIVLIAAAVYFASCSDDISTTPSNKPLFKVSLRDTNDNPVPLWMVGSVNHPIEAGKIAGSLKPCPETGISFSLPEASDWIVTIYNYNGDSVRTYSGFSEAGVVEVIWNGEDYGGKMVVSGFYRYHLVAGEFEDDTWMVMELGPDLLWTIIGSLDSSGCFVTNDIALFPGLIANPPIDYYTDTVTINLYSAAAWGGGGDGIYPFVVKLNRGGNYLSFHLDETGVPRLDDSR